MLQYDLGTVRGYLLKESFQCLWAYTSPYWADRFLTGWLARAMRSRIEVEERDLPLVDGLNRSAGVAALHLPYSGSSRYL